jgi:hypothetical protein
MKQTFTIWDDWRVFLLEDNHDRIDWFVKRIPNGLIATNNVLTAIEILKRYSFQVLFLDHDLGFGNGIGLDLARYLSQTERGKDSIVVIHSVNWFGAVRMKSFLPHAHVAPFGSFEIKRKEASA